MVTDLFNMEKTTRRNSCGLAHKIIINTFYFGILYYVINHFTNCNQILGKSWVLVLLISEKTMTFAHIPRLWISSRLPWMGWIVYRQDTSIEKLNKIIKCPLKTVYGNKLYLDVTTITFFYSRKISSRIEPK